MRPRCIVAIGFALTIAAHARADVTWTVSNCDANADCAFSLMGDAVPVTITLASGTLDYIGSASNAGYPTTPPIGNNADGVGLRTVTITAPRTGRLDVDPGSSFPGGSITVGGQTAAFAGSGSGSSWTATVRSTPTGTQRVTVNWINATQNSDCSPLPAWNSTDPARPVETLVEHGTLSGLTFTAAGETRVPMPATSTELALVATPETAVQARHVTASGALGVLAGPTKVGDPPTAAIPCVPPPTPVDCVVSDWVQGPLVPDVCPVSGTQTRTDTRTVLTSPENGGAACPELTQTVNVACVPPSSTRRVMPVTPGDNVSPAFGVTATGGRSNAVVAMVPVGTACRGDRKFRYRGLDFYEPEPGFEGWWGTSPTSRLAVACQ